MNEVANLVEQYVAESTLANALAQVVRTVFAFSLSRSSFFVLVTQHVWPKPAVQCSLVGTEYVFA
jgi:hypothetical protein